MIRYDFTSKLFFLLDFCKSIHQIKQTHAQLITTGLVLHPIATNKLLKLLSFSRFASISYAQMVFDHFPQPDLFLYNTIIKAHALSATSSADSFTRFRSLIRDGRLVPNQYSFAFAFKGCGNAVGVLEGEQVRAHAVKLGLENNLFVMNALIGMYVNLGVVGDARKVFDWSTIRDMYSWNIMLSGYAKLGKMDDARELFDEMPERDVVSWTTMIAGCVQ
ncbi:Pentatricopeptide repeat-containing protein, chloroplastic, partial [Cucurbita argyrosperma subsp. sororia]